MSNQIFESGVSLLSRKDNLETQPLSCASLFKSIELKVYLRGVFGTQSNIYDGDFFVEIVNC